jgi:two-component system, NarL family, response regulator YdfI
VIRVFLIAAAGPTRERWEELLESADATIVGRACDLEAVDEELADEAEIILIDGAAAGSLEDLFDSLPVERLVRETKVVLIVDQPPSVLVNRAIRAGIRGILGVEMSPVQVSAALEAIARGLLVLHPREVRPSLPATSGDFATVAEPLTVREKDVLEMLSQGLGNKQIAARLGISEHTVKFHVASILGKLAASTRTEAVSIALRRGLILL